jgi:hypothetical protein
MDHDDCDGADGWRLGRESWTFHRWFFVIYGRLAEVGEYSFLLRQLRKNCDPVLVVCGVYRLALPDGSLIMVSGAQGFQPKLFGVLPPNWTIGDPVPWQRDPPRVRHAAPA